MVNVLISVDNLVTGNHVLTKDDGARPVIWTGGRWYTPDDCAQDPSLRPVRISAGALRQGMPERDLIVSQQHRILISGPTIELYFDVPDVFVAAKHLFHLPGIEVFMPTEPFGYFHVLCAEHHVLIADGAEAESMFLGDEALHALSSRDLADLISQMSVASDQALAAALVKPTCRRVLKAHEALVIDGHSPSERTQPQTPLLQSRPFLCVSNETTRPSGSASDLAIISNTQEITNKPRAANM